MKAALARCACGLVLAGIFTAGAFAQQGKPAKQAKQANRTPVQSRVTILNIDGRPGQVVYSSDRLLEAPNWAPDSSYLLLNSEGALWKLPLRVGEGGGLAAGELTKVEVGSVKRINNDHGISPDGGRIAISAGPIYTLPAAGGSPRILTEFQPSYFHGWSPDGRTLVYCAEREKNFDIYAISSEGGPERRLTSHGGYDDGPDFSPDGKWIYFNSDRGGTWDIWRIPADGAGDGDARAERITSDPLEDWFPHPSPDGRWIVFLSFKAGTKGHPANQDVILRMMPMPPPAPGVRPIVSEMRELAKVFGGQGTMNVSSWAPDSKRFAFVSYAPRTVPEGARPGGLEGAGRSVPPLLDALGDVDPEVRWRAEFALGRIGAAGVPALTEALMGTSAARRKAAAYVVGPIGPKATAAVPALLRTMGDIDPLVRCWSAKAAAEIGPDVPEVMPCLIGLLRDREPDVRRVAVEALSRYGDRMRPAVPALTESVRDLDAGVRWRAEIALRNAGPVALPAAYWLVRALRDEDEDVRCRAAQALERLGPGVQKVVSEATEDEDPALRAAAGRLLGRWQPGGSTASESPAAHAVDVATKPAADDPAAAAKRAEWFNEAKFGLFIHWGLYSVPARARPGELAEWIMNNEKIAPKEYESFARSFSARQFDADEWVNLARQTGMRYVVLTAKHHEGFCLWDSALEPYNSVKFAAAKRDLVRELADACEKQGVKFCAYYSLLDWHHPDFATHFPHYVDHMHAQVEELLKNYPLSGLWFDGEWTNTKDEWRGDALLASIRKYRPLAVVNDRLGSDTRGTIVGVDYYTREQEIPREALERSGRPLAWETCQTFGYSWGYNTSPDPLKSGERVLEQLVDAASKGGNFLLNIGPRPDGTIPEATRERLKVIGAWMKPNGEAIYGTRKSPFAKPLPAGPVTTKGNRLFVFVSGVTSSDIALPGLQGTIQSARVLDGGEQLAATRHSDGTWHVATPVNRATPPFTVVAIELDGPVTVQE